MYTLGIDFGTESARALVVDARDGREVATVVHSYAHGVIDEHLPGRDRPLPPDWALQNPHDYFDVLNKAVPAVMQQSGIKPEEIAGIGVDFTSSTMVVTTPEGTPLCFQPEWQSNPHAWVKLWKHHAAQPQADQLNETARQMGLAWLDRYGGKISSEWFFSRVLQILQEAPEVYQTAGRFIEAGDWITWQMTGVETRSACMAGYKALVQDGDYPTRDYFAALDPRLADVIETHLSRKFVQLGSEAGRLTPQAAEWMGLRPGIPVATAVKVTGPGRMLMIMGTSGVHLVMGERLQTVEGMGGVVRDGIVPGLYGYEAGQTGFGDLFAWFVDHAVPPEYFDAAKKQGIHVHKVLENEAARQKVGEHGLLALDWWNGNRSTLVDADLTGLLIGATLATRAPDIYRALLEAAAFGTRLIIEAFERHGITAEELVLGGGLPEKNPLLVQICADVMGRTLQFSGTTQASALGAAIYAAVAAGLYPDVAAAAEKMGKLKPDVVKPSAANKAVYDRLYAEYKSLYDHFGRGQNDVMKRLKSIKLEALTGHHAYLRPS